MRVIKTTIDGIYNLLLGMSVTVKHLFKRAITLQYPKERWTMPERSRGIVVLITDQETNKLKCTACSICVKACPNNAIYMKPMKDESGKRIPEKFVVNNGICLFCGMCEEACPFGAIKLVGKYEFSVYEKKKLIFDKEKLAEIGRGY